MCAFRISGCLYSRCPWTVGQFLPRGGRGKHCRSLPQQSKRSAVRLRGAYACTCTNLSADLRLSLRRCLQALWTFVFFFFFSDVISLLTALKQGLRSERSIDRRWSTLSSHLFHPLSWPRACGPSICLSHNDYATASCYMQLWLPWAMWHWGHLLKMGCVRELCRL